MGYLTPLQRRGLALSGVALSLCAFIIAHLLELVKRVFEKNRNFFSKGSSLLSMGMVATHRLFGLVSQRGWLNLSSALPS